MIEMSEEFSASAAGSIVGSTVSNVIYHAISSSGEIAAEATASTIEITGNIVGLGAGILMGPIAGDTVRALAKTYSAVAKPTIHAGSKLSATGISFLAGTSAALTTIALIYGGRKTNSFIQSQYINYKKSVASKVQRPDSDFYGKKTIICMEDDEDIKLLEMN